MFILLFIVFHFDGAGNSSTESMSAITAEFSTKQRCESAAAELYKQKTDHQRIMWSCSPK